jgi:hypothetical protein
MKPRRTHRSNYTFRLGGASEDHDLWVEIDNQPIPDASEETVDKYGHQVIRSCWVPSDDERAAIAEGANIRLTVWGITTPPVAIDTTTEELGRRPEEPDTQHPIDAVAAAILAARLAGFEPQRIRVTAGACQGAPEWRLGDFRDPVEIQLHPDDHAEILEHPVIRNSDIDPAELTLWGLPVHTDQEAK